MTLVVFALGYFALKHFGAHIPTVVVVVLAIWAVLMDLSASAGTPLYKSKDGG